jgi:hypothetical protein
MLLLLPFHTTWLQLLLLLLSRAVFALQKPHWGWPADCRTAVL